MSRADTFSPMEWTAGTLRLIDQLKLPAEETWITCATAVEVATAIRDMIVRGAPAIGCSAAFGVALAARSLAVSSADDDAFRRELGVAVQGLRETRPTAVNLFWALDQVVAAAEAALASGTRRDAATAVENRAIEIYQEDLAMCRRIGEHGAALIGHGDRVLTHCNAGALATAGYGTALGVIRAAHEAGKNITVIADETRPYLQGARLTAWELQREQIDVTLIPDSAAPFLISRGEVSCVVVGADRIAANGDVANKIGTYSVALAAHTHGIPFYVAAPRSTVDLATATGADIPIEERSGRELFFVGDTQIAPTGVAGRYPAFDVTPAAMVSAIITDRGVVRAPYGEPLANL